MTTILVNEPDGFPPAALDLLRALGPVYLAGDPFDPSGIEAAFVRLAERIDQAFLSRHPGLRFVVSPTTGLNHIDLESCSARGIEILSLRGRTSFLDSVRATAEHTLALALALVRQLPLAVQHARHGGWDRYQFKGTELDGKRVLVLGYGRVGRQVEALYRAFGCQVRAHDVVPDRVPCSLACKYPDVLTDTDILSIHVNLVPETEGLVDEASLSLLSDSAIVVNTARGEVLDQPALFRMLRDGHLGGAALDVLRGEPHPFDVDTVALVAAVEPRRLLITPHISGFTKESLNKVEVHMARVFSDRVGPSVR
jgi:D-3-phosphoglycerate dehydrogenase